MCAIWRVGVRQWLFVLCGGHLARFCELEVPTAPVRREADRRAMAARIGDDGTVLDDRAARRVLARAPLFWEGEKCSSLAGARCEG